MLDPSTFAVEDDHSPLPTVLTLDRIRAGDNPRRFHDPKKNDDLVASLRQRGVLQPLLLRPTPADETAFDYCIVAGERRFLAALEAFGANGEVPVVIRDMTDQQALEAAIDENDCRDDASETEQADAAVRVLAACDGDRAEAARRLAWPSSKLDRRLALAGLTGAVKLALDERRIKVGHAELLAAVPSNKQDKALETIVEAGLSVTKTRELLMRMTQDLATACFDKTECATCPSNSALQQVLFETHVDVGHCTNPGCFQLKTETAEADRPAQAPAAETKAEDTPVLETAPPAAGAARSTKPGAPAPKTTVTAKSLGTRAADHRETVWRAAVCDALGGDLPAGEHTIAALAGALRSAQDRLEFDLVARLAQAFTVDLRTSWQVDGVFLGRFNKDELKFIAQECGLVEHMGAKRFAHLLKQKPHEIIAGMLHATGFDWAGRLPSCVTLDGQYAPPPDADEPEAGAEPEEQAEDPSC